MQIIRQRIIITQEQRELFSFLRLSVRGNLGCGLAPRPFFMPKYCNQSTIIVGNPPYIVTNPPFLLKKGVVDAWRVSWRGSAFDN